MFPTTMRTPSNATDWYRGIRTPSVSRFSPEE